MEPRPLTTRERAVLDALLAVDFEGVHQLRAQADEAVVIGMCSCGCPSIEMESGGGLGMTVRVNAVVPDSYDGLFLYIFDDPERGEVLGGIEWVGIDGSGPDELPDPSLLKIEPC